ncbi:hypothetical protein BC826DRAFT_1105389 [Russula brevipes]|nr:hypothetical protein BC826DRAFT_1105389 [Russula brevipes]
MPIPQTPTTLTVPVRRHRSYFIHEADVTIRVEDYMFRVHRFFLERESAYFRLRLGPSKIPGQFPPGSSEDHPLVLEEATSDAFACFLWVFYNPKYSLYDATPEQWSLILDLAKKWGFKDVERLCIRELEKLSLSPVDRIHIYQRFDLDDTLLLDSYESLTTRDEPIEVEEGVKLGLRTSLQIARAREMSRGPDTGGGLRSPSAIQLTPSDLRSLLSEIFELPRIQTNGAAYAGPFTAPVNHSDRLDRASALPATVPATPYKPEALSQSASTSEENRPTNHAISIKMPVQDTTKGNPRNKKQSSTSRWPNSWAYL